MVGGVIYEEVYVVYNLNKILFGVKIVFGGIMIYNCKR